MKKIVKFPENEKTLISKPPIRKVEKNIVFQGDNLPLLKELESNKIDLIYIDPPFCSQSVLKSKTWNKSLVSFNDEWGGGTQSYIHWLKPRLQECKRLLSEKGFFCLHLDYRSSHYAKIELDKIFGEKYFVNEIIVKRKTKSVNSQFDAFEKLNIATDSILIYRKSLKTKLKKVFTGKINEACWVNFYSGENRPTMRYKIHGLKREIGQWKWKKERGLKAEKNYNEYLKNHSHKSIESYWIETGKKLEFVKREPKAKTCYYWKPPKKDIILSTNWLDFFAYNNSSKCYPTKKSNELMRRIIEMTTDKGDMVFDAFCGCGTTINVAHSLNRKWLGCDISKDAIKEIKFEMARDHKLKIKVIKTGSLSKANILRLDPFDFERYVVSLIGQPNKKQRGDGGVDGYTYDHIPIQVKKSYKIGRPVLDSFYKHIEKRGCGIIIAHSFCQSLIEEKNRIENEKGWQIDLIETRDLIRDAS